MFIHPGTKLIAVGMMALALGACSGRDIELSEKLAAIEAAALRAEKAADRAEKAAKAAESNQAADVAESDAPVEDEATDEDPSNPDPNSPGAPNGG